MTSVASETIHTTVSFSARAERWIVTGLAAAFVLLALAFSAGPIFDGLDETAHYRFAREIARTGTLPDPRPHPKAEYHQAPLYYFVTAVVPLVINDVDFTSIAPVNPSFGYALGAPGNDNKNLRLHSSVEAFPYTASPTALAAHLVRLISIVLGLGTLLISYRIFRRIWPDRADLRLAALGFLAFWPQFAWLSSLITNDNMLIFTSTLSLFLLIRQMQDGATWRTASLLGVALGLALLSKASAGFLVLPVGVAFLLDRRAWKFAPLTLAVTVAVAGSWYIRNYMLFGEFTGVAVAVDAWQGGPISSAQAFSALTLALPFVYQTFWACFGNTTISVAEPLYHFFDLVAVLSLVGAAIWLVRIGLSLRRGLIERSALRVGGVIAAFLLAWIASLIYGASFIWWANQGRYLFPAVSVWAMIVALGLTAFAPLFLKLRVAFTTTALMAAATLIALFGFFFPAYQVLPVPDHIDKPLAYRYGSIAELIGMSPALPRGRPGETITISLYWRALKSTDRNLEVYLHSVNANVVQRDSFPGTGNLLSTDWQPGQTWQERYVVPIPANAEPQNAYDLVAGLYEADTRQPLRVTGADGSEANPVIGRVAVSGPSQPFDPDYVFGDFIGLARPTLSQTGDRVETCLRWVSLKPVSVDYHMFVHLLGSDGKIVAQSDFQPKAGGYPTSVWSPGEVIDMCIPLTAEQVSAGGWRVAVGLYNLADGQRPSVRDRAGSAQTDNMVTVSP